MHELLIKIHDIPDSAMSMWVGNIAHILAFHFNSASRQCQRVWTSQFSCLSNIKDTVPPIVACLYGGINLALGQPHQQSSLGLSQSSTSMLGSRAKQKAGFRFNVQK